VTSSHQERDEHEDHPVLALHVVQRAHQLKRAVEVQRHALEQALGERNAESVRDSVLKLARQMAEWEEALEQIRLGAAAALAERDRWQIAHDKLRERIDRHILEPRTTDSVQPPASRTGRTQVRAPAVHSGQDFSAIDRELERLNESMLRAFSSE
jgi:regulator of replication initiation timing